MRPPGSAVPVPGANAGSSTSTSTVRYVRGARARACSIASRTTGPIPRSTISPAVCQRKPASRIHWKSSGNGQAPRSPTCTMFRPSRWPSTTALVERHRRAGPRARRSRCRRGCRSGRPRSRPSRGGRPAPPARASTASGRRRGRSGSRPRRRIVGHAPGAARRATRPDPTGARRRRRSRRRRARRTGRCRAPCAAARSGMPRPRRCGSRAGRSGCRAGSVTPSSNGAPTIATSAPSSPAASSTSGTRPNVSPTPA